MGFTAFGQTADVLPQVIPFLQSITVTFFGYNVCAAHTWPPIRMRTLLPLLNLIVILRLYPYLTENGFMSAFINFLDSFQDFTLDWVFILTHWLWSQKPQVFFYFKEKLFFFVCLFFLLFSLFHRFSSPLQQEFYFIIFPVHSSKVSSLPLENWLSQCPSTWACPTVCCLFKCCLETFTVEVAKSFLQAWIEILLCLLWSSTFVLPLAALSYMQSHHYHPEPCRSARIFEKGNLFFLSMTQFSAFKWGYTALQETIADTHWIQSYEIPDNVVMQRIFMNYKIYTNYTYMCMWSSSIMYIVT